MTGLETAVYIELRPVIPLQSVTVFCKHVRSQQLTTMFQRTPPRTNAWRPKCKRVCDSYRFAFVCSGIRPGKVGLDSWNKVCHADNLNFRLITVISISVTLFRHLGFTVQSSGL